MRTTPITLTLEPGVELRFPPLGPGQPGAQLVFGGNGNSPDNKVGVLLAQGSESDPILFTSGADDPAAATGPVSGWIPRTTRASTR